MRKNAVPVPEWVKRYSDEVKANRKLCRQIETELRKRANFESGIDWGDIGDMNELNRLLEQAVAIAKAKMQ